MDLKSKILEKKLPDHVAIIMDGNGRWAKQQGMAVFLAMKTAPNRLGKPLSPAQNWA